MFARLKGQIHYNIRSIFLQRTTTVSCYKYLHCGGKTKVSDFILLRGKQKYHITSRSSKLSRKRFLAAFVILIEESFYLIARKGK